MPPPAGRLYAKVVCVPVILMTALLSCHATSVQAQPAAVRLCVDDNFAPFEYALPRAGHSVQGATVSLIERILKRSNTPYSVEWFPWTRCLAYIKQGTIQIGMDAYYDARRNKDIVYSEPYYTLTPQYYYSRKHFPHGLAISRLADLKRYRGCGVLGYSYTHYALKKEDLDAGALDHASLIRKLKIGRCDYFVEELEVMRGYSLTGQPYLQDPDLGHAATPGAIAPQLHFILSRATPDLWRLLPLINREVIRLRDSGEVQRLIKANLRRTELR
jgi:polar amino acid transport system substrate-binding protein